MCNSKVHLNVILQTSTNKACAQSLSSTRTNIRQRKATQLLLRIASIFKYRYYFVLLLQQSLSSLTYHTIIKCNNKNNFREICDKYKKKILTYLSTLNHRLDKNSFTDITLHTKLVNRASAALIGAGRTITKKCTLFFIVAKKKKINYKVFT